MPSLLDSTPMNVQILLLSILLSTFAFAEPSACYTFYSKKTRPGITLTIGEGGTAFRGTTAEISRENIQRLHKELGPLSPAEQMLYDRIVKVPSLITHRTSMEALLEVIKSGGLFSKNEILSGSESARQFEIIQANDSMTTPRAEDLLYDGSDFVFTTVSASNWRGDARYGAISIIVKKSHWERSGWGSEHSGWFYLKKAAKEFNTKASSSNPNPLIMDRAAELFKSEVFTPQDFPNMTAVRSIELARTLGVNFTERLITGSDKELIDWLNENFLGYLEGKIKNILLDDIERIEVPSEIYESVQAALMQRPVPLSIPIVIVD